MILKLHHIFKHNDKNIIINVEDMTTTIISKETKNIINSISLNPNFIIDKKIEEELQNLDIIQNKKEAQQKETELKTVPISNIALFVTQTCNCNCIYCFGKGGEYGSKGNMKTKTAIQAVDWLINQSSNVNKLNISFFGGEPLLNFPLIVDVVNYTKNKGLTTGKKFTYAITTNASLLDDKKITFLKKYNINTLVSFDGPKEIQNSQRPFKNGTGSFDKTLPKIKKLLKVLPETVCRATLFGDTNPSIIKKYLFEIGFSQICISSASKSLFDKHINKKQGITKDTNKLLSEMLLDSKHFLASIKKRDLKELKKVTAWSQLYDILTCFINKEKQYVPCGAALGLVGISCVGDIYPCHRFAGIEEYKLGNIFENNLKREKYQKHPIECVDICSKCFAKYICAGGCKYVNASSSGSILIPSEDMCTLMRRATEIAAYLNCQINNEDRKYLVNKKIITPKPCLLDF